MKNECLLTNRENIKGEDLKEILEAICKFDNETKGTGFFLRIPYDNKEIKVLLTCNHVLDIKDKNTL